MSFLRLAAAILLVVAVDAVALWGVARNRAHVDARVELTERELSVWRGELEDTALYLELEWQDESEYDQRRSWLDRAKLEELGFDVSVDVSDLDDAEAWRAYDGALPRRALAVLELDGRAFAAWREAQIRDHERRVAEARERERGEEILKTMRTAHESRLRWASRLVAIDVGLDGAALRERHPDGSGTVIVPCLVGVYVESDHDPDTGKLRDRWLEGRIVRLRVPYLHVPHRLRGLFEPLREKDRRPTPVPRQPEAVAPPEPPGPRGPRYRVEVAWGRRHEPWIESAAPLEQQEAAPAAPAGARPDAGVETEENDR